MSSPESLSRALVIGVSRYLHVGKLRSTRDVAGMREVLADPECCGFPPDRVTVVEEEAATRDHVLAALAATCERAAAPGSRTLIYFSGHGGQDPDGTSYILPVDARRGEYATTAISARELSRLLDRCAGELTVVLDCCRAAGMAGAGEDRSGLGAFGDAFRAALQSRGRVVFAASRADGKAYASPDAPYGIFTGHLLDGLRGAASTSGGDVTVHQLFDYVQQRVVLASHASQRPAFIASVEAFYPLTRYPRPVAPQPVFEADVYLSYDRDDPALHDWVARVLHPELARPDRGLTIWDHDDLGYSKLAVEQAIVNTRYTVVLLTRSYLANRLDELTTVMAVLQAVNTRTPRFIPILRELCTIPLYIDAFVGLDMRPAREMAFRPTLDRLVRRLQKQPHER